MPSRGSDCIPGGQYVKRGSKPRQFRESPGVEDWRVLSEGACAFFRTASFAASARLLQALSTLPHIDVRGTAVDVRQGGVTVRLITIRDDYYGMSQHDVELARDISATARAQVPDCGPLSCPDAHGHSGRPTYGRGDALLARRARVRAARRQPPGGSRRPLSDELPERRDVVEGLANCAYHLGRPPRRFRTSLVSRSPPTVAPTTSRILQHFTRWPDPLLTPRPGTLASVRAESSADRQERLPSQLDVTIRVATGGRGGDRVSDGDVLVTRDLCECARRG